MTTSVDDDQTTRQLRLRIGRLRRRIDRRLGAVGREGRRLVSWRTYVRRYPVYSLLAAFGLGLAFARGLRRVDWPRMMGTTLIRQSLRGILGLVLNELRRLWADSAPGGANSTSGGGDGERT
jgi:hypothetical protein